MHKFGSKMITDAEYKKRLAKFHESIQPLPSIESKKLGVIAIDTGTLLLTDPSYTQEVPDLGAQPYKQLGNKGWGSRLLVHTRGGDGIFPVTGNFDKRKRLNSISIDFTEQNWAPERKGDYQDNPKLDIIKLFIPVAILGILAIFFSGKPCG